jgi:hypothetical protein
MIISVSEASQEKKMADKWKKSKKKQKKSKKYNNFTPSFWPFKNFLFLLR